MSRLHPKKQLGQVFLKNKAYLAKIIKAAELKPNDLVLEIGAGTGVLTEALLKTHAQVIAIEKDPQLVNFLKDKFKNDKNLTIIEADIRDFIKNNEIKNLKLKIKNYKVVGNIPYYLTAHLIKLLLTLKNKPQIIVLMVQKEVAQRIVAQPPKMNLLAVSVQFYAKPEIISSVPKSAFWPQPKVDSAIIKLTPINTDENTKYTDKNTDCTDKENFFRVVKAGFSHPRKLALNNLSDTLNIPRQELEKLFRQLNLPLQSRAQELSLKTWLNLTQYLFA